MQRAKAIGLANGGGDTIRPSAQPAEPSAQPHISGACVPSK